MAGKKVGYHCLGAEHEVAARRVSGGTRARGAIIAIAAMGFGVAGLALMRWPLAPATSLPVCGSVIFEGVPLADGEVVFEPLPGGTAQRRWCLVKSGTFGLSPAEGLKEGCKYTVRVKGFRDTGNRYENANTSQSAVVLEQFLPSKWNTKSTIVYESTPDMSRKPLDLNLR